VIRECDVGRTVAVFTSLEQKIKGGVSDKKQIKWRDAVNAAGGIAEIVYTRADVTAALSKYR
jgi:hypothetical protein